VVCPDYRGALLAPWPNRVVGSRYTVDGAWFRLPVTEPDFGHALHGLVAFVEWTTADTTDAGITLATEIPASPGYPFRLSYTASYALDAAGLTVAVSATHTGGGRAPFGASMHPYLVAPGPASRWHVRIPARGVLLSDGRNVPVRVAGVDEDAAIASRFDLRSGPRVGERSLDHAYTGFARTPGGIATVDVLDETGAGVAVDFDLASPWAQVYTGQIAAAMAGGPAVAVEPMTCPPGAFNSGVDVAWLERGQTHSVTWRIRAVESSGGTSEPRGADVCESSRPRPGEGTTA
jgi:aldose 1-epimerase